MTVTLTGITTTADLGISILRQAADVTRTPDDLVDRMLSIAMVHIVAAKAAGATCPFCDCAGRRTDVDGVLACPNCGAVYTGKKITLADALRVVNMRQTMLANAGEAGQFYFDLTVFVAVPFGDAGTTKVGTIKRYHGWADRATKRVVQWG